MSDFLEIGKTVDAAGKRTGQDRRHLTAGQNEQDGTTRKGDRMIWN